MWFKRVWMKHFLYIHILVISFTSTFWFSGKSLYHLYSLPNIIRMIKARRMNWAIYVICMTVKKNVCRPLICKSSHHLTLYNLRMPTHYRVLLYLKSLKNQVWSLYKTCTIQVAEPAISLLLTTYLEAKFSTCIDVTISAWDKSGYKP
jgi:hypothetical protein